MVAKVTPAPASAKPSVLRQFGAVMWWEYRRHGRGGDAARVAAGALIARALVIALTCGVSLLLFAPELFGLELTPGFSLPGLLA